MLRTLGFGLISLGLAACAGDGSDGALPGYAGGEGGGGSAGSGASIGSGGSGAQGAAGGESGSGGDAGSGGAKTRGVDYRSGTWVTENISKTPGTITHDGRLAFVGSQEIFAWSEPDSIDINDQDVFAGTLGAMKPITSDSQVQNAFPALAVAGGDPVLAYNGHPDGDNDIYWAGGASFSSPLNLTQAGEATTSREDFAPAVAIAENGTHAVAYLSAPYDFEGEIEVRVLEWTGAPAAAKAKSVISGKGDCDDPAMVSDAAGALHVLSACGPLFQEHVYYATNASGTWQTKELTTNKGDSSTRLAITPDGKTLMALWVNAAGNVMFASSAVGDKWSAPQVAADRGYSPVLAADAEGRALVVFHRDNAQKQADVYFTSRDGTDFHDPISLTPDTDATTEWLPSAIAFEPETGYPHVLYVGLEAGSDPLNSDVWRAKLVPTTP